MKHTAQKVSRLLEKAGTACLALLLAAGVCLSALPAAAVSVDSAADEAVEWFVSRAGAADVQGLIESTAENAGSGLPEWLMLSLARYRYSDADYTAYANALGNRSFSKGTDWQRAGIASAATGFFGSTAAAAAGTVGDAGIMSWIYGLLLLDATGYDGNYSRTEIVEELLSLQGADGGWSLAGGPSDVDVTAMTVQALAPYLSSTRVSTAVEDALSLLSRRQSGQGDYASYGTYNAESTAQVILMMTALGLSPYDGRFVKNGCTALDGLLLYRLESGAFAHVEGGGENPMATVQALEALVSLWRQQNGMSSLFCCAWGGNIGVLDDGFDPVPTPEPVPEPDPEETPEPEPAASEEPPASSSESESSAGEISSAVTSADSEAASSESAGSSAVTESESAKPKPTPAPEKEPSSSQNEVSSAPEETEHTASGKMPLRVWLVSGAVVLWGGALLCIFLFRRKDRRLWMITGVAGAVVIALLLLVETPAERAGKQTAAGTVTVQISIDAKNAGDALEKNHLPKDGVLLEKTELLLPEEATVYDALVKAAAQAGLSLDSTGTPGDPLNAVYVRGIGGLYEFDAGDLSGWMYLLDGVAVQKSCSEAQIAEGSVIEWVYTADLGRDIPQNNEP